METRTHRLQTQGESHTPAVDSDTELRMTIGTGETMIVGAVQATD
jgi:hypothetical protein